MSLRVAFDLDGVLADLRTAYNVIAAKRLGITAVRSVEECLVALEGLQRQRKNPKLLDRLRQSIGAS